MNFVTIKVKCSQELIDLIIAEFFEIGFDSFQEFEDGFEGSCERGLFDENLLKSILLNYPEASSSVKQEKKVNWNEEWEKNYDPIIVEDKCLVRATFHDPDPSFQYEIVVNPKMSFGTGHHATTYQILAYQMSLDHSNKKVIDVGCGTGILAIMASIRGSKQIIATDIDDWCIENSEENFSLNNINDVQLIKGEIGMVNDEDFDIIIANINKNVLIDQINTYASKLAINGHLLLSGFYKDDVADLMEEAEKYGLIMKNKTEKENWSMLALIKPNP